MDRNNKYYNLIEKLVRSHRKFPGYEAIIDDIIDDVYVHSESIINSIDNEAVITGYIEKVVSTSIITVPKKLNFHNELKHRAISPIQNVVSSPAPSQPVVQQNVEIKPAPEPEPIFESTVIKNDEPVQEIAPDVSSQPKANPEYVDKMINTMEVSSVIENADIQTDNDDDLLDITVQEPEADVVPEVDFEKDEISFENIGVTEEDVEKDAEAFAEIVVPESESAADMSLEANDESVISDTEKVSASIEQEEGVIDFVEEEPAETEPEEDDSIGFEAEETVEIEETEAEEETVSLEQEEETLGFSEEPETEEISFVQEEESIVEAEVEDDLMNLAEEESVSEIETETESAEETLSLEPEEETISLEGDDSIGFEAEETVELEEAESEEDSVSLEQEEETLGFAEEPETEEISFVQEEDSIVEAEVEDDLMNLAEEESVSEIETETESAEETLSLEPEEETISLEGDDSIGFEAEETVELEEAESEEDSVSLEQEEETLGFAEEPETEEISFVQEEESADLLSEKDASMSLDTEVETLDIADEDSQSEEEAEISFVQDEEPFNLLSDDVGLNPEADSLSNTEGELGFGLSEEAPDFIDSFGGDESIELEGAENMDLTEVDNNDFGLEEVSDLSAGIEEYSFADADDLKLSEESDNDNVEQEDSTEQKDSLEEYAQIRELDDNIDVDSITLTGSYEDYEDKLEKTAEEPAVTMNTENVAEDAGKAPLQFKETDYSVFNYTPTYNHNDIDENAIIDRLVKLNKEKPHLNVIKIFDLKYRQGATIEQIAELLDLPKKSVVLVLDEMVELI